MKQTILLYNYEVCNSKAHLRIKHWLVADYPMTMTPRECLEEFCETVGWRLLECYRNRTGGYLFQFEWPRQEYINDTIEAANNTYESTLVEEVV